MSSTFHWRVLNAYQAVKSRFLAGLQGQVAAQQVIKEKAAAAKLQREAFKQRQHDTVAKRQAPAYSIQACILL